MFSPERPWHSLAPLAEVTSSGSSDHFRPDKIFHLCNFSLFFFLPSFCRMSKYEHFVQYFVCYCHHLVTKSNLTLWNPMNCNLLDSSVHGIFQARILEWVAISFSRRSSQSKDRSCVSCIAGGFFTTEPSGKPTLHVHTWNYLDIKWVVNYYHFPKHTASCCILNKREIIIIYAIYLGVEDTVPF